jgi:hypothetical protein
VKTKVTVIPLVALALAGCGGDDDVGSDSGDATAEGIAAEEWIQRADEICQRTDEAVHRLGEVDSLEDVQRQAIAIQGLVRVESERLRDLPIPDEISGEVDRMLALQDQEVESFDVIRSAALEGNQQRFESVAEEASKPGDEANQIAESLGMEECEEPYG